MKDIISKQTELERVIQGRYKKIKSDIDFLEYNTGYNNSINLVKEYAEQEDKNIDKIRDMAGLLVQYSSMLQNTSRLSKETYPVIAMNSMRLRGMIEGLIEGAKAFFNIDLSNEFTKWVQISESQLNITVMST